FPVSLQLLPGFQHCRDVRRGILAQLWLERCGRFYRADAASGAAGWLPPASTSARSIKRMPGSSPGILYSSTSALEYHNPRMEEAPINSLTASSARRAKITLIIGFIMLCLFIYIV